MRKRYGENLIFSKVDHEFMQLGLPVSNPSKAVFFIVSPERDVCGPLNLVDCKSRLPEFTADDVRYRLVERLDSLRGGKNGESVPSIRG